MRLQVLIGLAVAAGLAPPAAAQDPGGAQPRRAVACRGWNCPALPRPRRLAAFDYLPLAAGNLWIYRGAGVYAGQFLTLEITRTQEFHGAVYYLLHGLSPQDYWLRENEAGSVVEYDPAQNTEKVWWAFQGPLGQPYVTSLPSSCCGSAEVASRNFAYSGPMGAWDNALEIVYPGVFQVGIYQEVFLPDVGLTFRGQNTGGPSFGTWELIYARVGAVTRDSAPELSFGLALDSSIYTVNRMPPVDPSAPPPLMTARIRLRNTTAQSITLTYPTGQTFDFTITDAKGTVVYRWSDGQAFTQIVRTESVGPGEKDYLIQVPLAGADKTPFPAGKYVAAAWLTTAGAKAWSASVAFDIQWIY